MGDTTKRDHHWNRNSLDFITSQITYQPDLVRVATGFFSVPGYHQLRKRIGVARTHVLVGFDEDARQKLTTALIEEILQELRGWHADRYTVIRDLAESLGTYLRLTEARMRHHDHAKVFILGTEAVIVGSANLSQGGLRTNSEANTVLRDPASLQFWIEAFEERWNDPGTEDITEELRERLLAWLTLRSPWEVYLRASFLLLDGAPPKQPSAAYRQPTEYQQVVVNRVSKQLADPDRRGSLLIASTGLGKTIMATAAALDLREKGVVNRVLVFAPRLVTEEWSQRLDSARLSGSVFTIDLLFRKEGKGVAKVEQALASSDGQTLIVIDESHRLRNRMVLGDEDSGPQVRNASRRIEDAVRESGSRVLLLTATPYAADIEDIRNQLYLLPHTSGVPNVSGMLSLFDTYPWSVGSVEEIIESPVTTILNTPFVAKHFSTTDEATGAQYVSYQDGGRQYFPRLQLGRAPVQLPLEAKIKSLLDRRVLRHAPISTRVRHEWRKRDNLAETNVATAWASSPRELARTLREILMNQHAFDMVLPQQRLEEELEPILVELAQLSFKDDRKFVVLLDAIVHHARQQGQKVVVYSERLATVLYLAEGLEEAGVQRVASVVRDGEKGAELKPADEIERIIRQFAPRSNAANGKSQLDDEYDILLATDALSEGINLQDASFLVSYDLAWTADTIIQRAGRIMRLWTEPRTVELRAFVPTPTLDVELSEIGSLPSRRLRQLTERLKATETYTEMPLIPAEEQSIDRIGDLSTIKWLVNEDLEPGVAYDPAFEGISNILLDYTRLRAHRDLAESLGDDLLSARVDERVKRPTLLTVIRHAELYVSLRFVSRSTGVEEITDEVLFDHLRCEQDEPTALVDVAVVERMRFEAVEAWRRVSRVGDGDVVEHVCSVLVVPGEDVLAIFS